MNSLSHFTVLKSAPTKVNKSLLFTIYNYKRNALKAHERTSAVSYICLFSHLIKPMRFKISNMLNNSLNLIFEMKKKKNNDREK